MENPIFLSQPKTFSFQNHVRIIHYSIFRSLYAHKPKSFISDFLFKVFHNSISCPKVTKLLLPNTLVRVIQNSILVYKTKNFSCPNSLVKVNYRWFLIKSIEYWRKKSFRRKHALNILIYERRVEKSKRLLYRGFSWENFNKVTAKLKKSYLSIFCSSFTMISLLDFITR